MRRGFFVGAWLGTVLTLLLVALFVPGCGGETPAEPSSTEPVVNENIKPLEMAPVTAPPQATEAFCPFDVTDNLRAYDKGDKVEVEFDVIFGPVGQFLKRYQVEVANVGVYEAEVTRLGGRNSKTATIELPGITGKRVRVRGWFPDECHGDSNHGLRLNSQWSSFVDVR